jgi:hypothetical protein
LSELGLPPSLPTPLFEDNEAAIAMINENCPTPRVCHLDTQYFAIQEWRHAGHIQMFHIPGIINPADQQTKQSPCPQAYGSLRAAIVCFVPLVQRCLILSAFLLPRLGRVLLHNIADCRSSPLCGPVG